MTLGGGVPRHECFSGGYGSRRGWGYYGWSPLGLIILVILVLALTGNFSF